MHQQCFIRRLCLIVFCQGYVDGKILKLGSHPNDNKESNGDIVINFCSHTKILFKNVVKYGTF